jgi:hypothetical protein
MAYLIIIGADIYKTMMLWFVVYKTSYTTLQDKRSELRENSVYAAQCVKDKRPIFGSDYNKTPKT